MKGVGSCVSSGRHVPAGFEEDQTFQLFAWDAPVTLDRDRVNRQTEHGRETTVVSFVDITPTSGQ